MLLKVNSVEIRIRNGIAKLRGSNLKARSARGALTLATGTGFERVLRLVRNMILARVLAPNEFGLMAIVIAASTAFEAFAEVGVRLSVIQNKMGANNGLVYYCCSA